MKVTQSVKDNYRSFIRRLSKPSLAIGLLLSQLSGLTACSPLDDNKATTVDSVSNNNFDIIQSNQANNPVARLMLAELAYDRQQWAVASNDYLALAQQYPQAELAKRATTVAVASGNLANASAAAQIWVKTSPQDPQATLSLALIAMENDQPELALTTVNQLLNKKPDFAAAIILKTQILLRQQHLTAALDNLKQALQHYPKLASVRLLYGQLLLANGQYPAAQQQLQQLTNDPIYQSTASIYLAQLALVQKQPQEAKQYLQTALTDPAQADTANYLLGSIADVANQPQQALSWYQQVQAGDFYLKARIRSAAILAQQGKTQPALAMLQNTRLYNSADQKQIFLAEAAILFDAKQLQTGLDLTSKALKILPNDIDLLYAHSIFAQALEQWDVFEQDMRRILAIDPEQVDALNGLGYVLADRTTRYQEALQYISQALKLDPHNPAILDSMGWVQYRLGHHPQALEYLKQATQLSDDVEIAAHYGEVLWANGQLQAAQQVWAKALQRDPNNTLLLQTMQRFQKCLAKNKNQPAKLPATAE